MCQVLGNGNPLSKKILAPYLDDRREIPASALHLRVCDQVAEAISRTTNQVKFDVTSDVPERDAQIQRLKEYCNER